MFLSRVPLDLHKRATVIALANPQRFHGAVEQAFPENAAAGSGGWTRWGKNCI